MILLSLLHSVEFYVMAVVVAAATVALLCRRDGSGPARQYLLAGVLAESEDANSSGPEIELFCCEDGAVILRRYGLLGLTDAGALSLAIEVRGFDVSIQERRVEGRRSGEPVDMASFVLDFMGAEHYFISYRTELSTTDQSRFTSLTLHNRPGIRVRKQLI